MLASVMCFAQLSAEHTVLAFSASTRAGSCNKMMIKSAVQIATDLGAKVTVIDLKDYEMPQYDGDLEMREGMPENARILRNMVMKSDAVIIANPEYNGSVTGYLKNLIDWLSRDENGQPSREAFKNRRFAIMSASGGKGQVGLEHLRTILEDYLTGIVVKPMVLVSHSHEAFDENGIIKDSVLRQQLREEIENLLNY